MMKYQGLSIAYPISAHQHRLQKLVVLSLEIIKALMHYQLCPRLLQELEQARNVTFLEPR